MRVRQLRTQALATSTRGLITRILRLPQFATCSLVPRTSHPMDGVPLRGAPFGPLPKLPGHPLCPVTALAAALALTPYRLEKARPSGLTTEPLAGGPICT